jgi:hypothetical protein
MQAGLRTNTVLQLAEEQQQWKGLFGRFGAMKQQMGAADVVTGCQAVANALQMHVQPVMAASCVWLQANASGMHVHRLHRDQHCTL